MSEWQKLAPFSSFDPDAPASGEGIYGLPHTEEDAATILIPVPWEATTCYGDGAAGGPEAILRGSRQIDLLEREAGRPYEKGIALLPISPEVRQWSEEAKGLARSVIAGWEASRPDRDALAALARGVDEISERVNGWVYARAEEWLGRGRFVGLIGGDHSSPFGLIRALAERRPGLGVLQLDAHSDLREAYHGFRWSHASIGWNVLHQIPGVSRMVQVGIREYAPCEEKLIRESGDRLSVFYDPDLRRRTQEGEPWAALVREMIDLLPEEVYLSFDIDGLDPSLCPHTGTPVPGGLSFDEAIGLLRGVRASGRRIVGLDLCEVAPDPEGRSEWDGNVGARLLYKMIGYAQAGSIH
jgi:agmatinase